MQPFRFHAGLCLSGTFFFLLLAAVVAQEVTPPKNPLFDEFRDNGIAIPGTEPFPLPEPLVNEKMTPQQIQKGLAKAAGKLPFKLFQKGDKFSPIRLEVTPVPKDGPRHAHHIRLHMVALGSMEDVIKKNLLNQLIGGAKGKAKPLNAAQLKARNLKLLEGKGLADQYDVLDMELLEKVNISGITRTIKTTGKQAAYTTTLLDKRFAKDKDHPNAWQHVDAQRQADRRAAGLCWHGRLRAGTATARSQGQRPGRLPGDALHSP
ncbi:MAG: hypothetical protein FJ271_25570 [Planctomycetes bacterium]|nr:hypothetical protein [Planctomycetota bacterium]